MRKVQKILILMLFVCLSTVCIPGMKSYAEDAEGEQPQTESGLKDENPQRLEELTGMDENGNIYEVDETGGEVEDSGMALFSRAVSLKVVNFRTKGNAVTSYTEYGTGISGYTNGAYGADAAYLGESGGKVRFMLSGVVGEVAASEVQVVDFSSVQSVSCYKVEDGRLLHYITQDMTEQGHATALDNGWAPGYLQSGVTYYSYDGHYFYTDYGTMLQDYQQDSRADSVNPGSPYYNYYQYLPFRSQTGYSADELNWLISVRTADYSKMRNIGSALISNQNTYGVNALIMAGIAANESGWGTSSICNQKNNLFGLNAVDSSPGTSASTYASVEECIRQFADGWMSRGYLDPTDWRYKGGFLGNKASGLNVSYASDPYWGEKAANIIRMLDRDGGSRDEGAYTIGIKDTVSTSHNSINIRSGSSTSTNILYRTGLHSSYAVLLQNTEAENGFYQIQSDGVVNADRSGVNTGTGKYDYGNMYAYIYSDYVSIVNQGGDVVTPEPEPEPEPEPKQLESISITCAPSRTVYTEGECFDGTGMAVTARWNDGTEADITADAVYSTEPLQAGMSSITVSYTYEEVTMTAEQSITVNLPVTVTGVSISPDQTEMRAGESKAFGVAVSGTGNPPGTVTWSVEGAQSLNTSIDEEGRLKIGEDESADVLTVKAESTVDTTKSAAAAVTVVKPEADVPESGEPENPGTTVPDAGTTNPGENGNETHTVTLGENKEIWIRGDVEKDAVFTVEEVTEANEQYNSYIEPIVSEGHTLLGVYDIQLSPALEEGKKVELGFQVGEEYNEQEIIVLHYDKDGEYRYIPKVENGKITIEVSGFSPYVLAVKNQNESGNIPPEGDGGTDEPASPTAPPSSEPSNPDAGSNETAGAPEVTTPDDSADLSEPTLPDYPADTIDPTGPTDTTDTTELTGPTDPTDTTDPTGPADTTDTTELTGPTDPTDTTDPTGPADTADTDLENKNPAESGKPEGTDSSASADKKIKGDSKKTDAAKKNVQATAPKTGDESQIAGWFALFVLSIVGIAYGLSKRKRLF